MREMDVIVVLAVHQLCCISDGRGTNGVCPIWSKLAGDQN